MSRAIQLSGRTIRRIGVYGGKFDPIHNGHLIAAEWTAELKQLDLVLFVISANPPHKQGGVTDAEERYRMVRAATAGNPRFEASRIEIERCGPSYTVYTLEEVRNQFGPRVDISLMVSLEYLDPSHPWHLPKWFGADKIFQMARLLVFPRENMGPEQGREWAKLIPQARIEVVEWPTTPMRISSTMLRERVEQGLSIRYMTPPEVERMIQERGLYRKPRACRHNRRRPRGKTA